MKYIDFKKLRIQNFLSVGHEPVEICFKTGLNIITGINRDRDDRSNGVGKSTVADAIFFVLFGRTLRDLKKELIVNNLTKGTCAVEITFTVTENNHSVEYIVTRQIGPTQCVLKQDGKDITLDSIKSTTDKITKIINATADIFENCVLMTVNNAIPFMAKKKPEKRKFIESIFNLEMFSCMLTLARNDYNERMRVLDVECAKYEEISNSLQTHNAQKESNRKSIDARINELRSRQLKNLESIDLIKSTIDTNNTQQSVKSLESEHKEILSKIEKTSIAKNKISESISVNSALIHQLQSTLSRIGTDEGKCPVCLKDITEHDKEVLDNEISELKLQISSKSSNSKDLEAKRKDITLLEKTLDKKRNSITEKISDFRLKEEIIKNSNLRIQELKDNNSQMDSDIEQLKDQYTSQDKIIKDIETNLHIKEQEITSLKELINILDISKFVMSEEGVKAYIVNKILQLFNSKIAYYLRKLDSNCICTFNEYFEDQIINEKGHPCSYFNFSGAERKAIDLACLFAFMDIRRLQGSVRYNISLYDELLDSSFDEKGVDMVIDLLLERVQKYNECIVIISHRKESVKFAAHYRNTGEIIFLEKESGITRRVDFQESKN